MEFTSLPQLWETFELVTSVSSVTDNGYLTITMLDTYLNFNNKILKVTHKDFWETMSYFLYRRNEDIYRKQKSKLKGLK